MSILEEFKEKYPILWRDVYCGASCPPGWIWIVDCYSWFLEQYAENNLKEENYPKIAQVKEKFGELRIYTDNCPENMYLLEVFASVISKRICQECGTFGSPRQKGWLLCNLCEKCYSGNHDTIEDIVLSAPCLVANEGENTYECSISNKCRVCKWRDGVLKQLRDKGNNEK